MAEPVRDHFINGEAGPMTAKDAAKWWAANAPETPPESVAIGESSDDLADGNVAEAELPA